MKVEKEKKTCTCMVDVVFKSSITPDERDKLATDRKMLRKLEDKFVAAGGMGCMG